MGLRQLTYGRFASEMADFHRFMLYGSGVIVYGHSSDSHVSTSVPDWMRVDRTATICLPEFVRIEMATLRSRLGTVPIIHKARLACTSWGNDANGYDINVHRVITSGVNWSDYTKVTCQYKDSSTTTTWYDSAYFPVSGQDITEDPVMTLACTVAYGTTATSPDQFFDCQDELERALSRNTDIYWYFEKSAGATTAEWNVYWPDSNASNPATGVANAPYFEIWYANEIEFLQCDTAGNPDLSSLDAVDDNEQYYLGAWERGQTGTSVKGALRNFGATTRDLVEILDDHPEVTVPVKTVGSGSNALDYVLPVNTASSQKYTVKITPNTASFDISAEAWLDEETALNSGFGSGAGWTGTVGTDFTAPSGGLHIPGEAWQSANATLNDEYELFVRGNTTDTSWPSDSCDQIEIARDNGAGIADSTTWRLVGGRRITTTASMTIDATSKRIPVNAITPADWEEGACAFIGDDSNLNEGTVKTGGVQAATILDAASDTFTGSGLNDLAFSGNYNGVEFWDSSGLGGLRVEIDGTGTPDTFKWSKDAGSSWEATTVAITGSAQLLESGVYVTFGATTGHTSGDRWDADVNPFYLEIEALTANSNVYAAGSRVGTSLPIQDVDAALWIATDVASGASESQPDRIYCDAPDTAGFTSGKTVYVEDLTTGDYEELIVSAVTSTYIQTTTNMTEDYTVGSFVAEVGEDEAFFHLRLNSEPTTDEEMKTVRLAVRW